MMLGTRVAVLKEAPNLHTLHLDLSCNDLKGAGAQALEALVKAPQLQTVHFYLY